MTKRIPGAKFEIINRGDTITARYLNKVSESAASSARALSEISTEVPQGEDGDGSAADGTFIEVARTTTTVRIEDQSDPNVFVDIERIDDITFEDAEGTSLKLILTWP